MITREELKVGERYIFYNTVVEVHFVDMHPDGDIVIFTNIHVGDGYRTQPLNYFLRHAYPFQEPPQTIESNRFPEAAVKHDADKPRLDLIPPEALMAVGEVFAYGAEKYEEWNWRKGMEHSRLVSALLRHLMAHQMGEDKDPESGHTHLAHMACNALMLLGSYLNEDGVDDRWKKEK